MPPVQWLLIMTCTIHRTKVHWLDLPAGNIQLSSLRTAMSQKECARKLSCLSFTRFNGIPNLPSSPELPSQVSLVQEELAEDVSRLALGFPGLFPANNHQHPRCKSSWQSYQYSSLTSPRHCSWLFVMQALHMCITVLPTMRQDKTCAIACIQLRSCLAWLWVEWAAKGQ